MAQAALLKQTQVAIHNVVGLLDVHRLMNDGKIPPELLPDLTALCCACEVEASTEEAIPLAVKGHIRSMDEIPLNVKNQIAALRCDAPKTAAEPAQQQQLVAAQPPTFPAQPATPELSNNEYKLLSAASEAVSSNLTSYLREQSAATLATCKMQTELHAAFLAANTAVTVSISDAIRDTTMHNTDAMGAAYSRSNKSQLDVARHGLGLEQTLEPSTVPDATGGAAAPAPQHVPEQHSAVPDLYMVASKICRGLSEDAKQMSSDLAYYSIELQTAIGQAHRDTLSSLGQVQKFHDQSQLKTYDASAEAQIALFNSVKNSAKQVAPRTLVSPDKPARVPLKTTAALQKESDEKSITISALEARLMAAGLDYS